MLVSLQDKLVASIVPLLCAIFMGYLGYEGLYGGRGLVSYLDLNEEIERKEFILSQKLEERELLEIRTELLRPDKLDLDLLDERARLMLGYAHPNDLVIFDRVE